MSKLPSTMALLVEVAAVVRASSRRSTTPSGGQHYTAYRNRPNSKVYLACVRVVAFIDFDTRLTCCDDSRSECLLSREK